MTLKNMHMWYEADRVLRGVRRMKPGYMWGVGEMQRQGKQLTQTGQSRAAQKSLLMLRRERLVMSAKTEERKQIQVGWKWGRVAVCALFCLVLAAHPGWPSSRATPLGAGPGGKSIRAPGGRDVKHSHSAIWWWVTPSLFSFALTGHEIAGHRCVPLKH